ncbi:hypothetical protein VSU16_05075 [Cetobacterium somerae]|uniref:hypothetical protein n=1 Tax=Cetobacterium somerae TaxID=188913 RepID=UPI002E7B1DD3|nr:hypothetical protein [Cetobacterium somerae]WVJ02117.1 hypothetical protein VSU16_05075 [Cetobacterium somerae]
MLTIKLTNTSAGLIAIQRALAGEDITFTKLDIGDGVLTNLDISNFTGVINKIKDYPLGVVKPEGQEMVRLRANINNVGITEDKAIREFGLYAKFGSSEQEFLFAYMNTGDIPTALPSSSGGRYDLNRDFVLYIGSSTNVTFDTNGDLVYSTLNDYKALEAQKEDKFPKNTAFNRDFGVAQNQVLEGSKLAEILGIEYGGILNNTNAKVAGKGYYDTANKKIYKCTTNTSINYADAGYFIEVSNNDLLGKLQNLGSNLLLSDKTLTATSTLTVDGLQFSITARSYLYNNRIKYETISITASDSIVEGKTYSIPVPTSAEIPAKYWGYGELSMDSPNSLCIAQTISSPAILLITCLKKIYSGSGTRMQLTYIR